MEMGSDRGRIRVFPVFLRAVVLNEQGKKILKTSFSPGAGLNHVLAVCL